MNKKSLGSFYFLTYLDGFLFALMVATTESYALFYLAKMGVTGIQLGVISTVPILVAALSQLLIPRIVPGRHIGTALLISFVVQIAGLWGIFHVFAGEYSFGFALLSLTLYWLGGQSAAPFWVDVVSQHVSQEKFARYFSTRNMYVVIATMAFFILFSQFSKWNVPFQSLFLIGLIARSVSLVTNYVLLKRHPVRAAASAAEPPATTAQPQIIRQFILWGGLFRFSVNICSAFFLLYMVRDLALSTTEYVLLCAVPFLGRALFQRNWVVASGDERVYYGIQLATVFISLLPWLWTVSSNFYYLMLLQFLSGVFWGGMELTHLMMAQMHTYGQVRRTLGTQQAVFGTFAVIGAVLGGWLIERSWSIVEIFNLSTAARLFFAAVLLLNLRRFQVARLSLGNSFEYLGTLLSLRPSPANVMRVIPVETAKARENEASAQP